MKADRRKTVSQCLLDFIVPNMLIIQVRYDNFDLSMYC